MAEIKRVSSLNQTEEQPNKKKINKFKETLPKIQVSRTSNSIFPSLNRSESEHNDSLDKTLPLLSNSEHSEKKRTASRTPFSPPFTNSNSKRIKAPFSPPGKNPEPRRASSAQWGAYQKQTSFLIPVDVDQVPPTILNTQINNSGDQSPVINTAIPKVTLDSPFKVPTTPSKKENKRDSISPYGPKNSNNIYSPDSPRKQIFSPEIKSESETVRPAKPKPLRFNNLKRNIQHPESIEITSAKFPKIETTFSRVSALTSIEDTNAITTPNESNKRKREEHPESLETTTSKFSKTEITFSRAGELTPIEDPNPITPLMFGKAGPADFETPNTKFDLGERKEHATPSSVVTIQSSKSFRQDSEHEQEVESSVQKSEKVEKSSMADNVFLPKDFSLLNSLFRERITPVVTAEQNEIALLQFDCLKKSDYQLQHAQKTCEEDCHQLQKTIEEITEDNQTNTFSNVKFLEFFNGFANYLLSFRNFQEALEKFRSNFYGAGTKRLHISDPEQRTLLESYWRNCQQWSFFWADKLTSNSIHFTDLALKNFWEIFKKIPDKLITEFEQYLTKTQIDSKAKMLIALFIEHTTQKNDFQTVTKAIEQQLTLKTTRNNYNQNLNNSPQIAPLPKEEEKTIESKNSSQFKSPITVLFHGIDSIENEMNELFLSMEDSFKALDVKMGKLIEIYSTNTQLEISQQLKTKNNKIKIDIYGKSIAVATELLQDIHTLETSLKQLNKKITDLQNYTRSVQDGANKQLLRQKLDDTSKLKQQVETVLSKFKKNIHNTILLLSAQNKLDEEFNLLDYIDEGLLTQTEKDFYNDFILSEDKPSVDVMINTIISKESPGHYLSLD